MPKPFFTKLVAICAIGFFCVLFGCVYGFCAGDKIFLSMSLLIGLCSLIRFASLYHLIHTHAYWSVEGICDRREAACFSRNQHVLLADADGKEYRFSLDKSVKLSKGRYYRLYFRKHPAKEPGAPEEGLFSSPDFLGFEEITKPDKLPVKSET